MAPGLRRMVLPNPGPFTHYGTGVYVVGEGHVAVIDPGPDAPAFTHGLRAALAGETVEAILVTHTHRDHSPGAAVLKRETGAPTYGFGPHGSGPRQTASLWPDQTSDAAGQVEEGADSDFTPDRALRDGDTVTGTGWALTAVHTPGHTSNHLCYAEPNSGALFTGDHVMGWSTTVVSPPDGDMTDYMASLQKLIERDDTIFYPTHGPPITEPKQFTTDLLAHRRGREAQIVDCLRSGRNDIDSIVGEIYVDVPHNLHQAAARSVLSHLAKLVQDRRVSPAADGDGDRFFALS
ncbi:MAG: MBL fold metallo-hydrolase [Alphaproteobacteria bacterium]|nr:MBL fold metallo-hydrolase [Alphaproteobacteria bacterium]